MPSFETAMSRFETPFYTESGWEFPGVLQPIKDQKIYNDDFFHPRHIIRFRPEYAPAAGSVIMNSIGERFLISELDRALDVGGMIYEGFQAYPCNEQLLWQTEQTVLDTLTGLARGTGLSAGIPIWVLSEVLMRDTPAIAGLATREELKRVVVGHAVELNDRLGGMRVTKVNKALGIRVLELV